MAHQQLELQRGMIRLGDEFENGYTAILNRNNIEESGRMLIRTIGDQLERRERLRTDKDHQLIAEASNSHDPFIVASLKGLVNTVDTVLGWLEYSSKATVQNWKKQEAVLRGIFHLTDLGDEARFFGLLEFSDDFLDMNEAPYLAQRDFILDNQKDIEDQKMRILDLVNEAGEILKQIINDEQLDKRKGIQFDNIVRQADVAIKCCKRHLAAIKEKTKELSKKFATIKWFSRAVRLTGCVFTGCYFYQQYSEGAIGLPRFALTAGAATVAWFSLMPSRAYKFHESLCVLEADHSTLTVRLDDLRDTLSSAKDYKDGLMQRGQGVAV